MIATVLLHSILIAMAIRGGHASRLAKLPEAIGAGANSGSPTGTSDVRMIVIQLNQESVEAPASQSERPVLVEERSPSTLLEIRGIDSLPLMPLKWTDAEDAVDVSEADMVARTKLLGLYEGQIRARIERAWAKPAVAVEGGFNCRVLIRQDSRGFITELELQSCNGPVIWQQSLVSAVLSASPLPAPPNPAVFVDAFSLSFRSVDDPRSGQGTMPSAFQSTSMTKQ